MVLGDARISTAQSVFGSSSGYFDGTDAYLTTSGTSFDLDWVGLLNSTSGSDTNNRVYSVLTGSFLWTSSIGFSC